MMSVYKRVLIMIRTVVMMTLCDAVVHDVVKCSCRKKVGNDIQSAHLQKHDWTVLE